MTDFVNIIIPTIKIDNLLLICAQHCLNQSHNNFMLSIVTEDIKKQKKIFELENKREIYIDIIRVNNINISKKRNLAAFKHKSDYLAFIDSDAYPIKNWLKNSLKFFQNNNITVVTGPTGLPFPNESYITKLVNIAKRSYFCTGKWSKRKYSDENFFITQTESCNLIVKTKSFKDVSGMNENLYISEDTNFCDKINIKFGNNQIYFSGKIKIYHKDRNFLNFLKQRFVFGMYIMTDLSLFHGLDKYILFFPLLFTLLFLIGLSTFLFSKFLFIFSLSLMLIFYILVLNDINKFNLKFIQKNFCFFIIVFANFSYGLGNLISFSGLNKFLAKKIYRNSRKDISLLK